MPGYILHLTAAKMALAQMDFKECDAFFVGNLLPDTVKDKTASHFRNPKYRENMIEYPDLDMFLAKYQSLLGDASCLGYYFHLYMDRKFFKEYLPSIVTFLDADGQMVTKRDDVACVYIKRTKQKIPKQDFFSKEYYYGDYTRMNTYLVERFQLPLELDTNTENPGIEEVDYRDAANVLTELQGYLNVPVSAVGELRVFDVEELLKFLEKTVQEFFDEK